MSAFREIAAVSGMSLRSVPRRLGSSLVIVTGIAGVVLVLLSFLAMSGALQRTIAGSGRADRALVLRKGADSEVGSSLSRDSVASIENAAGIRKTADGKPMVSAETLTSVALPKKKDGVTAELTVRGVTPMATLLRPELKVIAGRAVSPGLRELMVGRAAQAEFQGLDLGSRVAIRDGVWTVVGIYATGGDARESELVADAETLLSAYQSSIFNSATVQLDSAASFDRFKEALANDPTLTVTASRETDYYQRQSKRMSLLLSFIAYVVGGIMAIGAMFGAVSTMYTAVSARTVEIATLRAIGFGAAGVVVSVLIEALLFATTGALAGALLAWTILNGRNISTLQGGGQVVAQLHVSPALFVTAIIWACVIGLIGGLLPAIRAAQVPVATALRAT
jgi:putative ABC transport system permease protein